MSKKNILIISNSYDEHVHPLVTKIQEFGGCVFRLDVDRYHTHFNINYNHPKYSFILETPVGTVNNKEIVSVWIRRPNLFYPKTKNPQQQLIKQETLTWIRTIPNLLKETSLIVDLPQNVFLANQKIYQLKLCHNLGIKTPPTLITSSPSEALSFYNKYRKNIVVKSIDKPYAISKNQSLMVFTTQIKNQLNFSIINNAPTLLQENIKKKTELRITLIGKKCFAVEFESQLYIKTRIDWRKDFEKIRQVPHRVVNLPKKLENQLFRLLNHYGLNFGAIDMAKTPEGEYVFFELNPAGQFLWLEDLTGLPLACEMAKFLLGKEE